MIRHHQPANRRLALHLGSDVEHFQNCPRRTLQPQSAPIQCHWPAQAIEPVTNNAHCESERQRHSAPHPAHCQSVSGARKRWRAAAESRFKSRSVRKSMVRNSRSHAGGAAMRAPIARYVFSNFGTLTGYFSGWRSTIVRLQSIAPAGRGLCVHPLLGEIVASWGARIRRGRPCFKLRWNPEILKLAIHLPTLRRVIGIQRRATEQITKPHAGSILRDASPQQHQHLGRAVLAVDRCAPQLQNSRPQRLIRPQIELLFRVVAKVSLGSFTRLHPVRSHNAPARFVLND